MLQPVVGAQNDYLEVKPERALDETNDRMYIVAEDRAAMPPGQALVIAPPMLDAVADGHAQFVVAGGIFIDRTELPFDHARRAAHPGAEDFSWLPEARSVRMADYYVVATPALHTPVGQHTDDLERGAFAGLH